VRTESRRIHRALALTALLTALVVTACASTVWEPVVVETSLPEPPVAKRMPVADTLHGDVRVDDYYWLREKEDPAVIAYLEAENDYTTAVMAHADDLWETVYEEMVGRLKETDLGVPYRKDGYYYYTRTVEGKAYPIYCRKEGSLDADEFVLLDQNELAEGRDYFEIGAFEVSPDHTLLAYSVDTSGAEEYTLLVKDLATGELLPDTIPATDYYVVWGNDNRTLFYTTMDDARRTDRVWRHTLGAPRNEDVLVHHEPTAPYGVYIGRTLSDRYLVMSVESRVTTEQYLLDADDPTCEFALVQPRKLEVEYYLYHRGDEFFIRTNDDAKNFKLMKAPVANPGRENWETVIPHREDVKLERVIVFANYLVAYERERGLRNVRIFDLGSGTDHYVEFPEPIYAVYASDNAEHETNVFRFSYMSLVTPRSIFDYDMDTRERELLKQREVLGGYDPDLYASVRLFAIAPDGVEVPISLVYRKDLRSRGGNPVYLVGYGAYGSSMDPWFSSNRLSLLDRGVIYGTAGVRGGGEMGETWWDDGRLLNKMNTFTDYIACAEHLVARGYTSPDRLVAVGGSAGGLLMGAVANMRPDLFHVIVADVPFIDVLNTMLDESIPLTVGEYDEWGNPNEADFYHYMKSYSPYDNVTAQDYPHMLITASLNDPRVQYWEPAKWTAKLRAHRTDDNLLLLRTNMGAGHGGASGRYESMHEWAFEFAFVLDRLGIVE